MTKIIKTCALFFLSTTVAWAQTITFAAEATYPPFESVAPDGKIIGFDIDIAQALCDYLKTTCIFENQPWNSLIPGLKFGQFDAVISAMQVTDERLKQVDFSKPYYFASATFVAPVKKELVLSRYGLKGKSVGVQGGTTMLQYVRATYGKGVKVNTYASIMEAFLDLQAGRIDAVLGDTPIMTDWLKKEGRGEYEAVGKPLTSKKFFGEGYAIAVKKDNKDLLSQLNTAIEGIKKDGKYQQIIEKYFGG